MALPGIEPIAIPDTMTVWAASDVHGQLDAVDRLLAEAGLTDGASRWSAPAGTALVITGDMVDRGPDSVGLVRRLVALREQAPRRGGLVALLEGNHEAQVLGGLDGVPQIFEALMTFGGAATLLAAGMAPGTWEGRPASELRAEVDALAPDFLPSLRSFAPYARWGDVLLVHGGPVPGMPLDEFTEGAERLWIRQAFFESPDPFPAAEVWTPYREAGIGRVVFGHTPVVDPAFSHEGRALNLDTWKGHQVTLARLEPGRDLREAAFLAAPAEPRALPDAAISVERVREIDAALPPVVKAWWSGARGRS